MGIAFLGRGSFGHRAAIIHFGCEAVAEEEVVCGTNSEVVSAVTENRARYGVVPLENSSGGDVIESLKAIWFSMERGAPLVACGELFLGVSHQLIGHRGATLKDITAVMSHSQALEQCRMKLQTLLPEVKLMSVGGTAEAVRLVMESGDASFAAIGSQEAAALYPKAEVLVRNVHDDPDNCTHFFILGHEGVQPTGADKTLLLFSCDDRPGGLRGALKPLDMEGLNADMIGSVILKRTNGRKEYFFYLEFDGHWQIDPAKRAIEKMRRGCARIHVVGSFPARQGVI